MPLDNVVPGEGKYGQGVATQKRQYSHDLIVKEALDFVRRSADRPFFLYIPLTIPHANNEAREKGMEVPDHGEYADKDWPEAQQRPSRLPGANCPWRFLGYSSVPYADPS